MKRRSNDLGDKPWVIITAVVGVIAVVVIALVFFMGSGDTSGQSPSGTKTTVPTTGSYPGFSGFRISNDKADDSSYDPSHGSICKGQLYRFF